MINQPTLIEERTIIKGNFNETADGEIVAVARDYPGLSQYIFPTDTSFERFIETCNNLNSSVLSNITKGKYYTALWNSDNNELTVIPKNHTEPHTIQIGNKTDFTPSEISKLLNARPLSADIMRFDTPAFSFSFEDGLAVFTTRYDIADEVNLLVTKLTEEGSDALKARQVTERLTTRESNYLDMAR